MNKKWGRALKITLGRWNAFVPTLNNGASPYNICVSKTTTNASSGRVEN